MTSTLVVTAVTALLAEPVPAAALPGAGDEAAENDSAGYSAPESSGGLAINGYLDVGFAKAQGDGTSYPSDRLAPLPFPRDYRVDPFAPAVNSRGDVAAVGPRELTNGFLPYSAGIGGQPSFLINTLTLDFRHQAATAPVLVFARLAALPRLTEPDDTSGQAYRERHIETRIVVEQAFGRVMPLASHELALFVGRFDSVFGIEYLDNQANLRTGITPSLLARYTTGSSVGGKLLYRLHIAPLSSAVSINASATNSGTVVESLEPPHASLPGVPVLAGRVGWELNLARVQWKVGASGLRGPRADQSEREALQQAWGVDARLYLFGVSLSGEWLWRTEDAGGPGKQTGTGTYAGASKFEVQGYWAQAAYALDLPSTWLRRATPYARFEHRHAHFEGTPAITVERFTSGLRLDLGDVVALKGEWLKNMERAGAPTVNNDVYTSSLVFSW